MATKRCSKCRDYKAPKDFHRNKTARDGQQGWCKTCVKNRRQENDRAEGKKWRQENPKYMKKWHQENPEYMANYCLMKKYGITLDKYNNMFTAQGGKCALCGKVLKEQKYRHPVDHDHSKSGRESVRGIVHTGCNVAIGFFENQDLLDKMKEYLGPEFWMQGMSLE